MAKKKSKPFSSAPVGSGTRFKACVKKLGSEKLCAYIGRSKYGKSRFQKMAKAGRKK